MANTFTPTVSSATTANRVWKFGGPVQQSLKILEGTLVIDTTANGGAVPDDLPASLFGLKKIVGTATIVNDGEDAVFHGSPDYTGDSLLVTGGSADGATMDLPNDTYKICIMGVW